MNYPGLQGGQFELLSEEEVKRIHNAALKVLAEVKIQVDSERYLNSTFAPP